MPSGVAILTGNTGPGGTVTALNLGDVSSVNFDFRHSMLSVTYGSPDKTFHLAWDGVTTVTFTISGSVSTITVS